MEQNKSIMDFWVFETDIRNSQLLAFEWLQKQNKKYLFLELPVGGGKSPIGVTYSRYLTQGSGNSYILTPQRILQEQYENSFKKNILYSLYGKSNYPCVPKETNCSVGSKTKPACDNCPHRKALKAATMSPNLVMNYTLALLHFAYLPIFGKRDLIVLDEAHVLEQHLTEFQTVTVTSSKAKRLALTWTPKKDLVEAYDWLVDVYQPALINKLEHLEDICAPLLNSPNLNPDEKELLKELEELQDDAERIEILLIDPIDDIKRKYILVNDKNKFQFKHLFAKDQFEHILDPKADKFLFMSATLPNAKEYCNDLGIDVNEAAFISLPSEFDADNRPVYFMPQMKMNASWIEDNKENDRNKLLKKIKEILVMHEDDSGVIHTGNFMIAEWLVKELSGNINHKIFNHNPSTKMDRNLVIEAFMDSRVPSILISPSVTEGLDLKDDISRFALFVKIPFGHLGDQWIKARMDLSIKWYQRMALIQVLQGCGRVVRSKDDWGNVYILDESWDFLYLKTSTLIPKWWKDAYVKIKK